MADPASSPIDVEFVVATPAPSFPFGVAASVLPGRIKAGESAVFLALDD
jgi:hypothetical protein